MDPRQLAMACVGMILQNNMMQAQVPFHPSASSPALQNVFGLPKPRQLEDAPMHCQVVGDETGHGEDTEIAGGEAKTKMTQLTPILTQRTPTARCEPPWPAARSCNNQQPRLAGALQQPTQGAPA